jgi:hypothetical protein
MLSVPSGCQAGKQDWHQKGPEVVLTPSGGSLAQQTPPPPQCQAFPVTLGRPMPSGQMGASSAAAHPFVWRQSTTLEAFLLIRTP